MKFQIRHKVNLINTTDAASWIANNVDLNETEEKPSICTSTCCILRTVQTGFLFLLIYAFVYMIKSLLFITDIQSGSSPNLTEKLGLPTIPLIDRNSLENPPPSTLLDIVDFEILLEPHKNFCRVDNLLFLFVVHSKPDHFRQRQAIRSTWGGLTKFDYQEKGSWSTRTVFILGEVKNNSSTFHPPGLGPDVNNLIHRENIRYKDIVVGSFEDMYRNLRYKNILGLRWASEQCQEAVFFLKADDDAFIDVPGLQQYLSRTFGTLSNNMENLLAGNVFPSGTRPQREGKWAVSIAEYPWSEYPSYLGGLAYMMTPDVAKDLYKVAHTNKVPHLWIDDVWVTGLLANSFHIQPLLMNSRYSYDHQEMRNWLKKTYNRTYHSHSSPYTFSHLDPSRADWKHTYENLWKQAILASKLTKIGDSLYTTYTGAVR